MTCVKTRIDDPAPTPPADGVWLYKMTNRRDGTVLWADSATDMVAAILGDPEYPAKSDEEALLARVAYAWHAWGVMKLVFATGERDNIMGVDPAPTGEEIDAFTSNIRDPVVNLPDNRWRFAQPLLVIDADYAPYTDLPLPQGDQVQVFHVADEVAFLQSEGGAADLVFETLD